MNVLRCLLLFISFCLCSCGGSGSESASGPQSREAQDLTGTWSAYFEVLLDECELTAEDVDAFEDELVVVREGELFSVESLQLPGQYFEGAMRSENSLYTTALLEGDLFGDGTRCSLREYLALNDLLDGAATALYNVQLECSDGFICDSVIRGHAEQN